MANEIKITFDTGYALYILVFNAAGQVWDQTNDGGAGSFEAYAAASIDNYDVVLSEIATASGQYRGTFPPNIDTGIHSVVAFLRVTAAPLSTDPRIGQTGIMHWDTTANTEIDTSALHIHVAAIQDKTDNLPTDPADASVVTAAFAVTDGKVDAVQTTANTIEGYTDKIDDATVGLTAIKTTMLGVNTWYVAKTGNNANSGKTWAEAKLTIATDGGGNSAVTASASGDTVYIGPGTYTETITLASPAKSLIIQGAGKEVCILTSTSYITLTLTDNCVLRGLSIISTHTSGMGVHLQSRSNVCIENCIISGTLDGLLITASSKFNMRHCEILSDYDAINVVSAIDFNIEDCYFYTSCVATVSDSRAVYASGLSARGVFRNCRFVAIRTDTQAHAAIGFVTGGRLWLDRCTIYAQTTDAGGTGAVKGFDTSTQTVALLITSCKLITVTAIVGGEVKDIVQTSGTVNLVNTLYDSTKVTGTVVDLTRLALLTDATRFAGADIATIKGYADILDDGTNGNAAIKAEVEGLAGAAMRGTDSAALASVCTEVRLAELAAANIPADIDIVKIDVAGLDGAAMRGTDSAALASVCTEVRLAELAAANLPADVDTLKSNETTLLARIGAFTGTGVNTILGFLKALASKIASTPSDVGGTFSAATDSLEAISEAVNTIGGTGAVTETYTCTDDITGLPIDGVTIWATTDLAGANYIDSGHTNTAGQWSFKHDLPSGTPLYIWRQMAGYTFSNPDQEASS